MPKFEKGNKIGNRIKKGEVLNPWGRQPRTRFMNTILRELQKDGFQPAKPDEIRLTIELFLNLKRQELSDIVNDEDRPMFWRIVARQLLGNKAFESTQVMLDRAYGKPNQRVETVSEEKQPPQVFKIGDIEIKFE